MNLILEYNTIQLYNYRLHLEVVSTETVNPKFVKPWLRLDHSNRGVIARHY
jgi:hypothetical protein